MMTMKEKPIRVYRGQYVESTHEIHVAVVDTAGRLLYELGDPHRQTFARSSMKPFQAVPFVESGAVERFGFGKKEIALACASHNGESFHRAGVEEMLESVGLKEEALQCGAHIPRDIEGYKSWIRSGKELTPIFSNCSGKHSGMLATIVYYGEDVASYRELTHPHQQRILSTIADICDYEQEKITIAVDGCGVPVHRLPLARTALGFAKLANPERIASRKRRKAMEEIFQSMVAYPEMVAGTKRFDTDVMKAYAGKVVAKAGAEGVQCLGIRGEDIGIAIKVEDGNGRATAAAAMEVLKQLGIGNENIARQLQRYVTPAVKNVRGDEIGKIKATFELKKSQAE